MSEQLPTVTMIQAGNLNIVSIGGGRVKGKVIRGRSQVYYTSPTYIVHERAFGQLGTDKYVIKL